MRALANVITAILTVVLTSTLAVAQARGSLRPTHPPRIAPATASTQSDEAKRAAATISADGLRAHMRFLADDLLEGRGTGTRGYDLAAHYVAAWFEALGLKPAGDNGTRYQNVPYRKLDIARDQSWLKVTRAGETRTLVMDKDFTMTGEPIHTDTTVEAPVVFAGFGITAPEFRYDDYAGVDAKGKIVAMVFGAPHTMPAAERAHYSSSREKMANAVVHGAIGMLTVRAGDAEKIGSFEKFVGFSHGPALRWLDKNGTPNDAQPQIRGVALLDKPAAEPLFAGTPKSLAEAVVSIQSGKPASFDLPVTVAMHKVTRHTVVHAANVAGVLPGSDPQLKNEYVVYTAHADHLGVGDTVNGDSIYNGAVDNASGTGALIEVAQAFASLRRPPGRSVLFLAVGGEEEGLLGSDYYAHFPTVLLERIAANINMDGVPLFYDFKDVVALGAEHSSLNGQVQQAAQLLGLKVSPDPFPEQVFFIRSDQYSFVRQGVPAVAISEGNQTVDPKLNGEQIQMEWMKKIYHTPKDDMQQPLNFNAAVKGTRMNFLTGYFIAQQEQRPQWNAGDFFGTHFGRTPMAAGRK